MAGRCAREGASRFELAPPRRFILPAILLLLSEQPSYGYGLATLLDELKFGHIDRPAVYRAAGPARAGRAWSRAASDQSPTRGPGSAGLSAVTTALGERVLRGMDGRHQGRALIASSR